MSEPTARTRSAGPVPPSLHASATWGLLSLPFAPNVCVPPEWKWLVLAAPLLPYYSRYPEVS